MGKEGAKKMGTVPRARAAVKTRGIDAGGTACATVGLQQLADPGEAFSLPDFTHGLLARTGPIFSHTC